MQPAASGHAPCNLRPQEGHQRLTPGQGGKPHRGMVSTPGGWPTQRLHFPQIGLWRVYIAPRLPRSALKPTCCQRPGDRSLMSRKKRKPAKNGKLRWGVSTLYGLLLWSETDFWTLSTDRQTTDCRVKGVSRHWKAQRRSHVSSQGEGHARNGRPGAGAFLSSPPPPVPPALCTYSPFLAVTKAQGTVGRGARKPSLPPTRASHTRSRICLGEESRRLYCADARREAAAAATPGSNGRVLAQQRPRDPPLRLPTSLLVGVCPPPSP